VIKILQLYLFKNKIQKNATLLIVNIFDKNVNIKIVYVMLDLVPGNIDNCMYFKMYIDSIRSNSI